MATLQTQYGRTAEWRDVPASQVPAVRAQWIRSVASAVGRPEREVVAALAAGEIIELAGHGIEWHDRIREVAK